MKDQTKIIVALAAGVAVGAVVGILLAPENRKKVAGLAKDIIDSAKDLADQVVKSSATAAEEDPETTLGV